MLKAVIIQGCFFLTLFLVVFSAQAQPGPCQCEGAYKDYDKAKGYYFDRVTGYVRPKISARFACIYTCKDIKGNLSKLSYILQETHNGHKGGGPTQAQWFICPYSIRDFIPKTADNGVMYYETTPFGPFYPAQVQLPDFRSWAASNSCAN